ncbi:MAG: gliding motility-associated C-terminal domain-containing protein [Bacteroidota bacterium]|nr:gliding motility-associated C-terminal domain-containing protein [Bacteroidota bacterium]
MKDIKKINKIKTYEKIIILFLFFSFTTVNAQTITPQVINSAGGNWTLPNGTTISDNVGEPFITTISNGNNAITQGFLQNFVIANVFSVSVQKNDVSCKDKNDGNISIALTSNIPSPQIKYFWIPQSLCPLDDCSSIDSLKPGTYTVTVKISYYIGSVQKDTNITKLVTIDDVNGPCKVKIYTGVTANGDGVNDIFTIENISEFPNNRVSIYNRWGQLLFDEKGYDNVTKFWPRKDEPTKLNSTTYFYILNLGDGSSLIKGWIELFQD